MKFLARALGGRISLSSVRGKGSTLSVVLPAARRVSQEPALAAAE